MDRLHHSHGRHSKIVDPANKMVIKVVNVSIHVSRDLVFLYERHEPLLQANGLRIR